jgi:hypothetical protein
VFTVLVVGVTLLVERRLLGEALGYLRRPTGAAA